MSLIGETKLAILREIEKEPIHGYALAESLDLSHGYIYTHLRDLHDEGMIELDEERSRKKIYTVSERGKSLLEAFEE